MHKSLIVLAAVVATGSAASARPVYVKDLLLNDDNGAFAYFEQQIADDFTLSSDAAISQATWYGNFVSSGDPFDTGVSLVFALRFYADTGAGPAATAFSTQEVTATLTDPGISQLGDSIYRFSASFAPVGLSGGVKYYLNIEEIDPSTPKPSFRWNNGGNGLDDDLMYFGTGGVWSASGEPRSGTAFTLDVPAPGTAFLGLLGTGLLARRRR